MESKRTSEQEQPDLPLSGKTVIVTRPSHQAASLCNRLEELGASAISAPAIELAPSRYHAELLQAVKDFSQFDWVIFTSVNGVHAVLRAMGEAGVDPIELGAVQVAAIGPATAHELARVSIQPAVIPDEFVSDALPEALGDLHSKSVLLPRADIARKNLPKELRSKGAHVTEIEAYRIVPNDDPELVRTLARMEFPPDYVTFTSSSTVRGLHMLLNKAGKESWFSDSKLVSIGPITAGTVKELFPEQAEETDRLTAEEYTTDGVIAVMVKNERGEL